MNSGRLDEYSGEAKKSAGEDGFNASARQLVPPAEDHRSLTVLLEQLQAAAGGKGVDAAPGDSPRRPLHILVDGRTMGAGNTGPMGILQV